MKASKNVRDFVKSFKDMRDFVKGVFFVQFQRFCVKILIFHRLCECVKMEKDLRDCVIGEPPWGGLVKRLFPVSLNA